MKTRQAPVISVRKQPRQARSARLVTYILEAAVRVLAREGAQKFTTARVAEAAGVSVGSLYQYFPNKEAILFRLQTDEWDQTSALLESILFNSEEPPPDRLRSTVRVFFQSEWEEASLRTALGDAAPLYRDAPEARKHKKTVMRHALTFMKEALPEVPANERAFVAGVVTTTMTAIGKRVSGEARSKSEVDAWALAIGETQRPPVAPHAIVFRYAGRPGRWSLAVMPSGPKGKKPHSDNPTSRALGPNRDKFGLKC